MYENESPTQLKTLPFPATLQAAAAGLCSVMTPGEARHILAGEPQDARLAHIKVAWLQDDSPLLKSMTPKFSNADEMAAAILGAATETVKANPPPPEPKSVMQLRSEAEAEAAEPAK